MSSLAPRSFPCLNCADKIDTPKQFTKKQMISHYKSIHFGYDYNCKFCGSGFETREVRREHERNCSGRFAAPPSSSAEDENKEKVNEKAEERIAEPQTEETKIAVKRQTQSFVVKKPTVVAMVPKEMFSFSDWFASRFDKSSDATIPPPARSSWIDVLKKRQVKKEDPKPFILKRQEESMSIVRPNSPNYTPPSTSDLASELPSARTWKQVLMSHKSRPPAPAPKPSTKQ